MDQETGEPIIPDGQSTAMTQALGTLSHLAAQADASDPSITTLGGVALGSRGASKRERLQEQLAQRSGSFLLQVSQQALRRLTPSEPVPTTRAELTARRPVFTLYAERFGEFGSQRGFGDHVLVAGQHLGCLTVRRHGGGGGNGSFGSQDSGSWDTAYLLTLMEDPPRQLCAHRPQSQNPRSRAFGGLTPQPWATTTLAYIKEIDAIQARRTEATSSSKAKPPAPEVDPPAEKNPRRPRFPKKPKDAPA